MLRRIVWIIVGVAGLAVTAVVLILLVKWSGKKQWEEALSNFRADGESLDPDCLHIPQIEDGTNFGASEPLWGITLQDDTGAGIRFRLNQLKPENDKFRYPRAVKRERERELHMPREQTDLTVLHAHFANSRLLPVTPGASDHAADILKAFEIKDGDLFDKLLESSKHPGSQLVPRTSSASGAEYFAQPNDHLGAIYNTARGCKIYSIVALRLGESADSAGGVRAILKLARISNATEKSLIAHLISLAACRLAIETVWEGLAMRVWDEDQLMMIEKEIAAINLKLSLLNTFRTELAMVTDDFEEIIKTSIEGYGNEVYGPSVKFFSDQNKAFYLQCMHYGVIKPLKEPGGYLPSIRNNYFSEAIDSAGGQPKTRFATISFPSTIATVKNSAISEAFLAQASAACALERHFLTHGSYPTDLRELNPAFVSTPPLDPIDLEPMRYVRTNDGRFQLWSIGWDGEDDGGGKGDITWNYLTATPDLPANR